LGVGLRASFRLSACGPAPIQGATLDARTPAFGRWSLGAVIAMVLVACACTPRDPAAERAALVKRGAEVFGTRCAPCHGPQGDWPMTARLKGRTAEDFYALFDHLPSVNPIMPPFDDAPAADRRAVAAYLASLKPDTWGASKGRDGSNLRERPQQPEQRP
jgi:mono/diheme cytochrome c family protein